MGGQHAMPLHFKPFQFTAFVHQCTGNGDVYAWGRNTQGHLTLNHFTSTQLLHYHDGGEVNA